MSACQLCQVSSLKGEAVRGIVRVCARTRARAAGIGGVNPKTVAVQMGWSSVSFTLENYARFMPAWGDNGAMDETLG